MFGRLSFEPGGIEDIDRARGDRDGTVWSTSI